MHLIFHGAYFQTVPFYHHEQVQEWMPKSKLIIYKDQGHDVLITRWRAINEEIETFLISK